MIESTGLYTNAEQARAHLAAGAKKVIITAPAQGSDLTVCMGVNEEQYDPVAKVVLARFGIVKGLMTAVCPYAADQRLLDNKHQGLRCGRTTAINIVPTTTTDTACGVPQVLPELTGKFDGLFRNFMVARVHNVTKGFLHKFMLRFYSEIPEV